MQKSGSRIADFGINDIVNGGTDSACARKYREKVQKKVAPMVPIGSALMRAIPVKGEKNHRWSGIYD